MCERLSSPLRGEEEETAVGRRPRRHGRSCRQISTGESSVWFSAGMSLEVLKVHRFAQRISHIPYCMGVRLGAGLKRAV